MVRLPLGAVSKKTSALALVSLLMASSCPVFGQTANSISASSSSNDDKSLSDKLPLGDPELFPSSVPPEVTDPQPIAQAPNRNTNPIADPYKNYLPTTGGSVQIRRPFKLSVSGGLIHNLSFRDASVRAVLSELSRLGNINILVDKSVTGNITGDLKDMTVSEALDSVLAASGLQSRTIDNNTVVVGSRHAMITLGLNRTIAKAFHLSYADPWEVAQILSASVFNTGLFLEASATRDIAAGGATDTIIPSPNVNYYPPATLTPNTETGAYTGSPAVSSAVPIDQQVSPVPSTGGGIVGTKGGETTSFKEDKRVVTSIRKKVDSVSGFNDAGVNPEKIKIQGYIAEQRDFEVSQNNGGALVVPDVRNRQIVVVGTPDDLSVAEQAIHLLDKRPREVHIQVSLIELRNEAIRQFGATMNLQGEGVSSSIAGNSQAPLITYLPGLGSAPIEQIGAGSVYQTVQAGTAAFVPPPAVFTRTASFNDTRNTTFNQPTAVAPPFTGILGTVLPAAAPTIAGVVANPVSQSALNFLTLSRRAGGRTNIATLPAGLNFTLNMLLQTNKAKILANPSLVAVDNSEAFIELANEIVKKIVPVITTSAGGNVTVPTPEITKVGIFLDMMPKIADDGFVTLRIRPRVSVPLGPPVTFGVAPLQTQVTLEADREVISQEVRIKDGQTLVLGGLFTESEAAQIAKVPYLAETPIFGAFFRNTLKGRNRTELMLLITPKIIEEQQTPVADNNPGRQM